MKSRFARALNDQMWRRGIQVQRLQESKNLSALIFERYHPDFSFVQIGANDGVRFDPVNRFVNMLDLHGLVVEPLPDMFKALKQNYRGASHISFANVAVHRTERELTLYRVKSDAAVPDWAHGIASSDPSHYELHDIQASDVVPVTVPAVPLAELLDAHKIAGFDLFVSDVEGYDAEVISMLLETTHRPSIILFEHGMGRGTMNRDTYLQLTARLMAEGYFVLTEPSDAIAYLPALS